MALLLKTNQILTKSFRNVCKNNLKKVSEIKPGEVTLFRIF